MIWIPQGRLGNLLFQYQAALAMAVGGRVVCLRNETFDAIERQPGTVVLPVVRGLRGPLERVWARVWGWLSDCGLVGSIEPRRHGNGETADIARAQGWLRRIFVLKGFFQSPDYAEPLPTIRPQLLALAECRLASIPRASRVAVHVRLGDYVTWCEFGMPGFACLPAAYYEKAIASILAEIPEARFIVVSDEADKALAMIAALTPNVQVVASDSALEDFALIASCSHAIVSASTFSWWAATMIRYSGRILLAPKYWSGFRQQIWLPPTIETGHFNYIEVASTAHHAAASLPTTD